MEQIPICRVTYVRVQCEKEEAVADCNEIELRIGNIFAPKVPEEFSIL